MGEENKLEKGKRILGLMTFSPAPGNFSFGFPFFGYIPGNTQAEKQENYNAVGAFLSTTSLKRDSDYEWSFNKGDDPKLNIDPSAIDRVLGKGEAKKK